MPRKPSPETYQVAAVLAPAERAALQTAARAETTPEALEQLYREARPAGPAITWFMAMHLTDLPGDTYIPCAMAALAGLGEPLTVKAVLDLAVRAGMTPPPTGGP